MLASMAQRFLLKNVTLIKKTLPYCLTALLDTKFSLAPSKSQNLRSFRSLQNLRGFGQDAILLRHNVVVPLPKLDECGTSPNPSDTTEKPYVLPPMRANFLDLFAVRYNDAVFPAVRFVHNRAIVLHRKQTNVVLLEPHPNVDLVRKEPNDRNGVCQS